MEFNPTAHITGDKTIDEITLQIIEKMGGMQKVKFVGDKADFDNFAVDLVTRIHELKKQGRFKNVYSFILKTVNGVERFEVIIVTGENGETVQQVGERVGILKKTSSLDVLISKYTDRLNTMKENRVNELEVMDDKDMRAADREIEITVEYIRDLKALKK